MTDEKPKRQRDRKAEYARRKARELQKHGIADEAEKLAGSRDDKEAIKLAELSLLAKNTANLPTDADRDIDFAYKNSGNPTITPLMCPSLGAWQWYEYARMLPDKFLEICAKREDAKAKQAGTITSQRMEDDKRKQFAILDRIEKQLTIDVKTIVRDLMSKFPDDVIRECKTFKNEWASYFERYPE